MRYLLPHILRILEEGKMAFVAGPRQVGKTTLAKHLLDLAGAPGRYFNWDIETHRKAILKDPENFWRVGPAAAAAPPGTPRVALDEIHKYPRWKRFLKGFYDANKGEAEIVVTGSGRLDIYQRGGDSLFGRYGLCRLHPFSLGEWLASDRQTVQRPETFLQNVLMTPPPAGADKGLAHLEKFSGFPEPLFAGNEERLRRWRRSHRHVVLREDLRDLTRVRDLGLVESLITLLPERIGSPLSLNALAIDLQVAFGTLKGWLEILSRLYYLFEIRPYAGRLARALRREGKVYLFDPTEIENPGARFENVVALHLRKLCDAWNDWGYGDFELYYVRDKEKREVDFLVTERRKPHLLLEAKLSDSTLSPSILYFRDRLKPRVAMQVVREAPLSTLQEPEPKTHVVSAARLLCWI